jgi:quaternary ammonium compound-resistance protein SugE
MNAWTMLGLAGLLEVCWAVGLKYTAGFTRPLPSAFTLTTLAGSMWLLSRAAQTLPIGTAYGVWVGIGAVGAAVMGVVLFKEPITGARFFFLALMVTGLVGLKLTAR